MICRLRIEEGFAAHEVTEIRSITFARGYNAIARSLPTIMSQPGVAAVMNRRPAADNGVVGV